MAPPPEQLAPVLRLDVAQNSHAGLTDRLKVHAIPAAVFAHPGMLELHFVFGLLHLIGHNGNQIFG
jgi:hypothetical protein